MNLCTKRFSILFVVLLLVGAFSNVGNTQGLGQEWESLTAEESKIVFAVSDQKGNVVRYFRAESHLYDRDILVWTGTAAKHAKAVISYISLPVDRHFATKTDPKSVTKNYEFLEGKAVTFSKKENYGNKLGIVKWRRFNFDDVQCFAFSETFGRKYHQAGFSAGSKQVSGYYCANPGRKLENHMIRIAIGSLGIRGIAVPDDPPELLESASLPDEKAKPRQHVPISIIMEGSDDKLTGRLFIGNEPTKGALEIQLPLPYAFCVGSWERLAGKYGTVNPPNGKWHATCSNGATLSGGYESKKPGVGSGRGRHSDGREITFTFGG